MYKIVLISSGQPSLNPRLVKEADALADNGYQVTVLYAYWNEWGTAFDKELIASKKWRAVCVGGDPFDHKRIYFISRIIHKTANMINKITKGNYLAEFALSRASYFLTKEAKKHGGDLYIGHNLGAISAVVKAARFNKGNCGFDAEDFHRNEISDDIHHPDVILKSKLEELYIPQVDYITASSENIGRAYQELFPGQHPVIIRNVFSKNAKVREPILNESGPIKLFWFSQTIGMNRGLDKLMEALKLLTHLSFEVHLLGNVSKKNKEALQDHCINDIYFHAPILPDDLPLFASQFDVGLALEPGFSTNNDLALSNKIFTYLQGGLALVASDTPAQKDFLSDFPSIGRLYPKNNPQALSDILSDYYTHRNKLYHTRRAALKIANEELNWESESRKFLKIIERTIIGK